MFLFIDVYFILVIRLWILIYVFVCSVVRLGRVRVRSNDGRCDQLPRDRLQPYR